MIQNPVAVGSDGKAYISNESRSDFHVGIDNIQGRPTVTVSFPDGVVLKDINSFSIMALLQIESSEGVEYACFYGYSMGDMDISDYALTFHGICTRDLNNVDEADVDIPDRQSGTIEIDLESFGLSIQADAYVGMKFFNAIITV